MKTFKISINDAKKVFTSLGCDSGGISILGKKSTIHTLYISQLHVGAANILKQDALSIGADLAVPSGVIIAKDKYVDAILIGSTKHFEILSRKELSQPFGLKELAKTLKSYLFTNNRKTKIMGVLNANDDSFNIDSHFNESNSLIKIENMIEDGADIIDIGAVSSKPGSVSVSIEEEFKRIKPIIDLIYKNNLMDKVDFSLDSYEPKVLDYALNHGFKYINDITGLQNDEVCKIASKYNAPVIIMHMQNNPKTMQVNPSYENIILEIDDFFTKRIQKAKNFNIKEVILDVGIGFGKNLEHNLTLLNNLEHFKHFGYELLIGASRKSMISDIVSSTVEHRLPGTLSIHLEALKKGASIIRCHDVKEHFQAIKVQEAITNSL